MQKSTEIKKKAAFWITGIINNLEGWDHFVSFGGNIPIPV
jgi:hypothetical protein